MVTSKTGSLSRLNLKMKTTPKKIARAGFNMLPRRAQRKLYHYEHTIICLMALIAATSIVWSISIHIISGDLYNGFLGAKLKFHYRNFDDMNNKTKLIFNQDLENILKKTYSNQTDAKDIKPMRQSSDDLETSTSHPKKPKLAHLLQISSSVEDISEQETDTIENSEPNSTEPIPIVPFDLEADRQFLSKMAIDPHQTAWSESPAVQFLYSFSFMSEIIAIIWAAMCLVFQSGVKKYWGLPKPWRIVVPSILMFSVMAVGNLVYTILANQLLKELCLDLREPLTGPAFISCGNAFTLLRPVVRPHVLSHDAYLSLFKISYTFSLLLWSLALLVMVFRYLLAIDFQLVEIEPPKLNDEFIEVSLNSPKRQPPSLLRVIDSTKLEDDFQSAKTHLSEAATPLLEPKNIQNT